MSPLYSIQKLSIIHPIELLEKIFQNANGILGRKHFTLKQHESDLYGNEQTLFVEIRVESQVENANGESRIKIWVEPE